jgi:ABC-type multidrug transport system fused ATPase/permease subunit
MYSVSYNAHRFFLSVDPVAHTTRSSGKIIAKIVRASESLEDFIDIFTFEILRAVVRFATVVVIFFGYNLTLGIVSSVSFFFLMLFSIVNKLLVTESFEKYRIKDDDEMKAANLENLQSIQLIRSSFASIEQNIKLRTKHSRIMGTISNLWMGHITIDVFIRWGHLVTMLILSYTVFTLVDAGQITTTIAVALVITYITGSEDLVWIGRKAQRMIEAMTKIKDLYAFVNKFGKQTYPVLETERKKTYSIQKHMNLPQISLDLQDIDYTYGEKTKIFAGHTMHLAIDSDSKNKLYGIIGPSGTGKTTLLSILGGQLKPTSGHVLINGLDIYKINDSARKELLALQMQTASNLRGELRYNLLLGLPGNIEPLSTIDLSPEDDEYEEVIELMKQERAQVKKNQVYSDKQLIDVLKKVGLWNIFKEKEGLETLIGEGGLNLSGGQRQRLNFASLYLRSRYYQPEVILIDEPTSSLDEISEKAITSMIAQLAETSVTLVIAHRLKTLENSAGILDLSLLEKEKELRFYPEKELRKKSDYYDKLMKGELDLDE